MEKTNEKHLKVSAQGNQLRRQRVVALLLPQLESLLERWPQTAKFFLVLVLFEVHVLP